MRTLIAVFLTGVLLTSCAPVNQTPPGAGETEPNQPKQPVEDLPSGLQKRVEAALEHVADRDLLTTHSFWTIIHGVLGNGPDVMLRNPDTNERQKAIEYICDKGGLRGLNFFPTRHGLDVRMGPTFVGQGHQDQFIGEMAQIGMPRFRKFTVHGKDYTFDDFINHAQARASLTAKPPQELSWTLVVLSQYRGTESEWTNDDGVDLKFTDLVRYEATQPIDTAACGGTHRLFGLTWAYHIHLQNGGKTEGVWKDVAALNERQIKRAKKYQNADGSFSTRYLAGPENVNNADRRINTTGHVLEWLSLVMTNEQLREPWVEEAANRLALMILSSSQDPIDSGSLYHASHGLRLYHARVFGDKNDKHNHLVLPLPPSEK